MVVVKIILGIALYWFAGWFYAKKLYKPDIEPEQKTEYTYSDYRWRGADEVEQYEKS